MGREVIAIAHNKYTDAAGNAKDEKYFTFTKLDAEGKPLWIRDARGNLVMQYITPAKANNEPSNIMPASAVPCYDIAGNLLFQHSMDAGDRWMLMDAAGKPMLAWDTNQTPDVAPTSSEARIYLTEYDKLHRPTKQWLTINTDAPKMVERFEYIDTGHFNPPFASLAEAQARNLCGQLYQHYDPSGRVQVERIDFKGSPLEVQRRLVSDHTASVTNWQTAPDLKLETETFTQITEYDALKRMTRLYNWHRLTTPDMRVAVYDPRYNQRGLLSGEQLVIGANRNTATSGKRYDEGPGSKRNEAIVDIRYNAKGQKELLKLGNGTTTKYAYDLKTFRLTNIETRRPIPVGDQCSSAFLNAEIIQDLRYTYDPVGNITQIVDAAQAVVYQSNQRIDPINLYEYDALYRLIQATGKENRSATGAPTNVEGSPLSLACPAPDPAALRNYTQTYRYDPVGNIEQMHHVAAGGDWTRNYAYAFEDSSQSASNRLWRTWQGDINWNSNTATDKVTYGYDTHGNMLNLAKVTDEYRMQWDHRDMIRSINLGGGGTAYYQYDSGKQRTRKRIVNQNSLGGYWERVYLGSYELYRRYSAANLAIPVEEIESLHLLEGEQRVLLVDDVITASGAPRPDGLTVRAQTLFRYQYSNHLGSACLELDHQADVISYEEYHPYGTSAYHAVKSGIEAPPKRYRFTGMERDEESGLSYHGARHYVLWLGRWTACDPKSVASGINLYLYCSASPSNRTDPNGQKDWGWVPTYSDPNASSRPRLTGNTSQELVANSKQIDALVDIVASKAGTPERQAAQREHRHWLNAQQDALNEFDYGVNVVFPVVKESVVLAATWPLATTRLGLLAASAGGGFKIGESISGQEVSLRPDSSFGSTQELSGGSARVWHAVGGLANVALSVGGAHAHVPKFTSLPSLPPTLTRTLARPFEPVAEAIGRLGFADATGRKLNLGDTFLRFFLQQTRSPGGYTKVGESLVGEVSKRLLPEVELQMGHVFIQQSWFKAGGMHELFPNNEAARMGLQRLGNAGINLMPMSQKFNAALGRSAFGTAAFATGVAARLMSDIHKIYSNLSLLTDDNVQ